LGLILFISLKGVVDLNATHEHSRYRTSNTTRQLWC